MRSRPRWRLSRRARAASWATDNPPVSSMKKGRCCNSIATSLIFSKSRSLMPPRRMVLEGIPLCSAMIRVGGGGDPAVLGVDRGGELLRRHFHREEPDDAAVGRFHMAVGMSGADISP